MQRIVHASGEIYYIDKTEVTRNQYYDFLGDDGPGQVTFPSYCQGQFPIRAFGQLATRTEWGTSRCQRQLVCRLRVL